MTSEPKVTLISKTANLYKRIVDSIRICRKSEGKSDTEEDATCFGPNDEKLVRQCIDAGHESIFEHVSFTFRVEVSRVTQQQITRHRLASYMCESGRHTAPANTCFYVPTCVAERRELLPLYLDAITSSFAAYDALKAAGIENEEARYCLPLACVHPMLITANLRELRHMVSERTCKTSQKEIFDTFTKISKILSDECSLFLMGVSKCPTCKTKCK